MILFFAQRRSGQLIILDKNFSEFEVTNTKPDEPNKWKAHNAYVIVASEKLGYCKKITKISFVTHLHVIKKILILILKTI